MAAIQCPLVTKTHFFRKKAPKIINISKTRANLAKLMPFLGSVPPNYPLSTFTLHAEIFLLTSVIEYRPTTEQARKYLKK